MPDPRSATEQWQQDLAGLVGRRVAYFRKQRKLTAAQLSDELKERLGFEMKRTVIGGLETGTRRTVGLAEILALANVLSVPPLLLMVPLGDEDECQDEIEIVPGTRIHPWLAAQWIVGDGLPPFAEFTVDQANEHLDLVNFLGLYRQHNALVGQWARTLGMEQPAERAARQQEIENALALVRWSIRDRDGVPPPLPPGLAAAVDQHARPHPEGGEV